MAAVDLHDFLKVLVGHLPDEMHPRPVYIGANFFFHLGPQATGMFAFATI